MVTIHSIIYPSHTEYWWWRYQMDTFSALLAICARNSLVTGEFLAQRPVMRSFGVFVDLRPNKRLSKQSWGWWFGTPSRPLWRHCNVLGNFKNVYIVIWQYWHDADYLAMQDAKSSAAMLLTNSSYVISILAPEATDSLLCLLLILWRCMCSH